MEIAEHLTVLGDEGRLLAQSAERAGLDTAIPTCTGWQVKDLLRHTGYIHRWAARHIAERPETVLSGPSEAEILAGGAPDPELLAWFRAGHAELVETLSGADPGLICAKFMEAPSSLAFWARRQAHETAVHRADVQIAAGVDGAAGGDGAARAAGVAGVVPGFGAEFAADGIDELVLGFGRRRKHQPVTDGDVTLRIRAVDTGDDWYAEASEGRMRPRRGTGTDEAATCTVSGPAAGLYLFLWNRADAGNSEVSVVGDVGVYDVWAASMQVRWG